MTKLRVLAALLFIGPLMPPGLSPQLVTEIGLQAGPTFTTLRGDDADDFETRTGLTVGGFASFDVNDGFAVRTGLSYTRRGGDTREDGTTLALDLDYVDLSLLGRLRSPLSGPVHGHLLAGPVVSFETACDIVATAADAESSIACDGFRVGDVETVAVDAGVALGGGIFVEVGRRFGLLAEGLYTLGLRRLDATANERDLKNEGFLITAGLVFRPGR